MRFALGCLSLLGLTWGASASGLGVEAAALLRSGQAQKAIQLLRAALNQDPQSPEALYYLVRGCRIAGDKPCAAGAARRLLEAAPDSAYTHKLLAEALDAQFREADAEQELRRAAALEPTMPEVHFSLGMIDWRRGEYGRAREEFLAELKYNPSFARTTFFLADIALRQDKTALAIEYLTQSLRADPGQYDALCELGKAYASVGRDSDAIVQFRTAAALKPEEPTAHYRLSRLLRKAGRAEEADREQELARRNGDSARFGKTVR